MPVRFDPQVWKGNTFRLPIGISTVTAGVKSPVNLTGSSLVFLATWSGGSLRHETGDGSLTITDAVSGEAALTLSVAETRALPIGRIKYEIERRLSGDQTTILYGELVVTGWSNDD